MSRVVALLRGVNVGGKSLSMSDLREAAGDLGYGPVATYIQSGNVIVDAGGDDPATVAAALAGAIESALGVRVPVIARSREQLEAIVAANPYPEAAAADPRFVLVGFLGGEPDRDGIPALAGRATEREDLTVAGNEVYLSCPDGFGRSKLGNDAVERALGVTSTIRNWRTVLKLLELATT